MRSLFAVDVGNLEIVAFERDHLPAAMELFAAQRWSYAADAKRTWRALTSPNSITLVALLDGQVVGVAQTIGDGEFQTFLSALLVAPTHRRRGIGRALIAEAVRHARGTRIDLISCADELYEALGFRRVSGFRCALPSSESDSD